MPHIPAICPNGHVFNSGIFVENAKNLSFDGNSSKCPICGNWGSIPDGVYDIVDNSINFLRGPKISRKSLTILKEILEDVRNKKVDILAVSGLIKEETPELKSLADILPKTRNDLYNFLMLLLAILTFILQTNNSDKKGTNEIINNITINQNITSSSPIVQKNNINEKISNSKVGRNKPCPCNSGKKYKHCHGR